MMMGDCTLGTLYVLFGLDFLLTCVFSDCIGLFFGEQKRGCVFMFAQRDFFFSF